MPIPISSRIIDYYTPQSWPDPWEIIYNGECCYSSVSLLMAYTLRLNKIDFELLLINDGSDTYLVPVVDDTEVLNYALGEVIELERIAKNIDILQRFNATDLKEIN